MSGGPPDTDNSPRQEPRPKGGGGGSGGGGGGRDRCSFTEITTLSSPDPQVVATLTIGQTLHVVHEEVPHRRVVAMTDANLIAGSITSAKLVLIIECIGEGRQYVAVVTGISGGRVSVEIRPV